MKPKKTARISLKVPEDLRERLDDRAAKLDRSRNWLAQQYLERGLDADERKTKMKGSK